MAAGRTTHQVFSMTKRRLPISLKCNKWKFGILNDEAAISLKCKWKFGKHIRVGPLHLISYYHNIGCLGRSTPIPSSPIPYETAEWTTACSVCTPRLCTPLHLRLTAALPRIARRRWEQLPRRHHRSTPACACPPAAAHPGAPRAASCRGRALRLRLRPAV